MEAGVMRDALDATPRKGSRLARLGIWSAALGAVALAGSAFGARAGLVPPMAAMVGLLVAGITMLLAVVFAGLGLLRSGGTAGTASRPATWLALLAGIAVTAVNVSVIGGARGAPPIHDITTDTVNPPPFVAIAPLRVDAPNPPEYSGPETAALQRQAFPDIGPLRTSAPAAEVFARAREVVADSGWTLVEASEADGRIEATAETPWVRFKDDVVIRITSEADGQTRVDVRSKSRMGRGDMGQNAKRVRGFLADLKARLAEG
jgi:uncharacterized protein (DUF1499 family)